MSYLSTVAWIQKTFTTRQRTAELLRPELEQHTLSRHDYELAARFLPGSSMNWHLIYGAGTSAALYGYGFYFSRPKWSLWRLRLGTAAAFLAGSTYGTFRQFLLHYRFANSLENPHGFILALNHIDERLGGSGQIGFAFSEILVKKPEIKPDPSHAGHVQDTDTVVSDEESGWVHSQDNSDGSDASNSDSDSSQFKTRWDEIRAVNSRNAGQSSWDIIRQRHERSRLPVPNAQPSNSSSATQADERAVAQAKFDALLEAERRRGQLQDDRE